MKTLLTHILGVLPELFGGLLFCGGGCLFLWFIRRDLKSGFSHGYAGTRKRSVSPNMFWWRVSVNLIFAILLIGLGVSFLLFAF
jgi:hypothetical protein